MKAWPMSAGPWCFQNHPNSKEATMNRELLEKPFEPSQIKQREGNFGKTLDYIEGHAVIQRLNDALEAEWSFSVISHEVLKETDEVIVLGELKTYNVVKTQFGSSKITRAKNSGEPISLADDYKAAATDCLKKCATMLGVGLHLYTGDKAPAGRPENGGSGSRQPYQKPNTPEGNGDRKGGNGEGGRITNKQLGYIVNLGKSLKMNSKDLDEEALKAFGSKLAYLTVKDASAFIDHLKQMSV
jgi:hypothetical protein